MDLDAFTSACQAFIFNWPGVSENARRLQRQFADLGVDIHVVNSDESEDDNGLPNWVNIGDSGYMVQQYAKARELFSRTYFLGMFADIYDVEAELILKRACHVFSTYDCGAYAPNIDFMAWNFRRRSLPKLEKHLYEVPNAESLLTFIHRDVLTELVLDPEKYRIGWGIDFVVSFLADQQGKKVIRDYITTVTHPRGKGYSNAAAAAEMEQFINDRDPATAAKLWDWIAAARKLRVRRRRQRFRKYWRSALAPVRGLFGQHD